MLELFCPSMPIGWCVCQSCLCPALLSLQLHGLEVSSLGQSPLSRFRMERWVAILWKPSLPSLTGTSMIMKLSTKRWCSLCSLYWKLTSIFIAGLALQACLLWVGGSSGLECEMAQSQKTSKGATPEHLPGHVWFQVTTFRLADPKGHRAHRIEVGD